MKSVKRWLAVATAATLLFSSVGNELHAQGNAYYDGQNATAIPPEWAFGGLLALSLAIVCLQNGGGNASH